MDEKERCPLCHAEAVYVGLENLECPTRNCPNFQGSEGERTSAAGEQLRLELERFMSELRSSGARVQA